MNAVLYAAGRGHRLGARAGATHKILLEFNGRSLLERHVAHLAALHVPRLYLVTGHERQILASQFPPLQLRYGVELIELFNPDFLEGSILSMHTSLVALRQPAQSVLLMDGDVLYGLEMLQRLVQSPHRTALLIDRAYSTGDDDPVLVPLRNGQPFDFVKRWRGDADAIGESVGFFKVGAADLPELIDETERRVRAGRRGDSYDDVLRTLIQGGRFAALDITGLPWIEIDFPHDLERARHQILPAIEPSPIY